MEASDILDYFVQHQEDIRSEISPLAKKFLERAPFFADLEDVFQTAYENFIIDEINHILVRDNHLSYIDVVDLIDFSDAMTIFGCDEKGRNL